MPSLEEEADGNFPLKMSIQLIIERKKTSSMDLLVLADVSKTAARFNL